MTGPRIVRDLGDGWTLRRRWYYGRESLHGPGVEAEVRNGELEVVVDAPYDGKRTYCIPVAALKALLEES